jgi:exosortase A
LILLLTVVPLAVYADTVITMVGLWSGDAYRHGYMIPIISIGLLWRDRANYRGISFAGSWLGVGLLCVLVALWVVSEAAAVQVVEQASVVLMVSAFALSVIGWSGYRYVWFPLAFLLLAVPVGATAVPYLMDSTATIAVAALQMLNVPALREGMLVSLPAGTFEVVEACSGFNYLNAGIALGVLVAHLMFRTVWKQIFYIGVVAGVFILVNGLRAFIVMYVGSMSDMRLLVGEDHVFFGWVLFLAAMAMMYWLAEKYSDTRDVEPTHAPR